MKSGAALLFMCLWATNSHVNCFTAKSIIDDLDQSPATVTVRTTRSSQGPHLLHVDAFDQRHTLRLHPTAEPFTDTFRLQTTARDEEGRLIVKDVSHEEDHDAGELYQDPESGGVVRMTGNKVEGIISPTLTLTAGADGKHKMMRQEIQDDHDIKDFLEVPLEERLQFESSATTRTVSSATVEMYIIVDSTLATALGTNQEVKNYLAVFWNAVRLRYATSSDPAISLILSGALIVRNAADEPYITNNIMSGNIVDGYQVLYSVSDWLAQQNLPAYDMAYLMTGKDMSSGSSTSLAGLAWTDAACLASSSRVYKVGMGEDNNYYRGVMTAAHEVAHNLGSPHDGYDESASCSWDLGYIMSYKTVDAKKLLFSSCSKAAMKSYISQTQAACLQTTSTGSTIPLSNTLPGQILSLDKQCQIITEKSNAYVSTSVPADSLCYQLVCQWKVQDGSTIWTYTMTTGRPAAEGSPCRTGGACKDGSCQ